MLKAKNAPLPFLYSNPPTDFSEIYKTHCRSWQSLLGEKHFSTIGLSFMTEQHHDGHKLCGKMAAKILAILLKLWEASKGQKNCHTVINLCFILSQCQRSAHSPVRLLKQSKPFFLQTFSSELVTCDNCNSGLWDRFPPWFIPAVKRSGKLAAKHLT